jgi:serine/threonine-protein kinase SRPK3
MYEVLTGDLLFQPRKTDGWSKNEDHLAQMQELIGPFHPHYIARSPKRSKYFEKNGKMKKFQVLNHYSLDFILRIKHKLTR